MTDEGEKNLYERMVHGLRSQGWSRIDAEGEALDRLEAARKRSKELHDAVSPEA